MCFGMQDTGKQEKVSTANPAVASAATGNLDYVTKLRDAGFQGYNGPQVANFSDQQKNSFGLTDAIVGNGTGDASKALINTYSGAPAQSVTSNTIASGMSPYMNEYVMRALAPQMRQMDISNAKDMAGVNSAATSAGAFGDARAGIEAANTRFNQNVQREGVIGNAYDKAFNTAIGASAQDQQNNMGAQTANANYMEQALARALGGSSALQGLQNQQLGVAGAQNQMGQQQTAREQAELTAKYNQWLMAQQQPRQDAALVNQTVAAGSQAMPASTTTTEQKPDNSGWALGGTLLSAFI